MAILPKELGDRMLNPLSDEAIVDIMGEAFWLSAGKRVAQEVQRDTLRQLVGWGNEPCPHRIGTHGETLRRWGCDKCWQQLERRSKK